MSSMSLKRFPGFIDTHVHLRDPGTIYKEDFYTGSRAAIKGGFTFILDMPNNSLPTISVERLNEKIQLSDQKAICDIGFHYGTNGYNTDTFKSIWDSPRVYGLKIYCNHTTGEMLIEDEQLSFGVPGIETAVGLIGKAIYKKIIPASLLKTIFYDNPKRIFNIPDQRDTYIEINPNKHYIVKGHYETKCGWTPFEGWELVGKVENVKFKGKNLIESGNFKNK